MSARILVYGSYGYTGDLVARFAREQGIDIVLSGRNAARLGAQAERTGFESIVADLDDARAFRDALDGVSVVIHCAGPFSHTYRAVAEACLETGTHYTDITGEAAVFEGLWRMDADAQSAGVMLLPGTGFDVVPSDCLAAHLKSRCPTATHLELAFRGRGGGVSHGTATTMVENLADGGAIRRDGVMTQVPAAWGSREIDFGDGKPVHCMTIPWGDVITAFKSTDIPNIVVYTAVPPRATQVLKLLRPVMPLMGLGPVQSFLKKRVDAQPAGPSDETRAAATMELWGEAKGPEGEAVTSRLRTPEGYTLTAAMALRIAAKIADGKFKAGFQTPSTAFGKDLILELEGTERFDD